MVMRTQVLVFWVVTTYSDVTGYQRFEGPCCLHDLSVVFIIKLPVTVSEGIRNQHTYKLITTTS